MKRKINNTDNSKKATQIKINADKFIRKGRINKAISEWEKLLSNNMDGSVYNTIGDLNLKNKKIAEAIEAFQKSAKIFRKGGLILQAIAIYKKIINVSPSAVDALIAIADLNAEKGLKINAIENYVAAAEIYDGDNETEIALGLYDKALELTPKNTGLKIKVAEINDKYGHKSNAAKLYDEAASVFLESGDDSKAKKYFLMAMSLNPESANSLTGLSVIEEREPGHEQSAAVDSDVTVDSMADIDHQYEYTGNSMEEEGESEDPDVVEEENPDAHQSGPIQEPFVIETNLAGEEITISATYEETAPAAHEDICHAIPVNIKEKRCEAEFYEMYGFINEAISEYEELLALPCGDQEYTEFEAKLLSLKAQLGTETKSEDTTAELQIISNDDIRIATDNIQDGGQQELKDGIPYVS